LKDAYYFSHDSNAKDDPKCVLLIEQLGLEGYGIFWVLIETLRDQPEYKYPLALIPALSRRYNTTTEKMKTVVSQYGLFNITPEGEFFFSESLFRRMESLSTFRESQRKKALKRWNNAPALPRESHGNADHMPVKESKVKKRKVKDSKEDNTPDEPASKQALAEDDFSKFWKAYPKKRSKGDAEKAWKSIKPDSALLEKMLKTIGDAKKSTEWTKDGGKWIPYPGTWLRAKGWEDEMKVEAGAPEHKPSYDIAEYEQATSGWGLDDFKGGGK
jgi:hypothetical protein